MGIAERKKISDIQRNRKREPVPADLLQWFRKYVNEFFTRQDACDVTGLNPKTLKDIMDNGSTSTATIIRLQALKLKLDAKAKTG